MDYTEKLATLGKQDITRTQQSKKPQYKKIRMMNSTDPPRTGVSTDPPRTGGQHRRPRRASSSSILSDSHRAIRVVL